MNLTNLEKEALAEQFNESRTAIIRRHEDTCSEVLRTFSTGATRSPLADKLCYSGFISPAVLHRFAQYMHQHRTQTDGCIREPDNWKRGIDPASYIDSLTRHFVDVWMHMDGCGELATEDLQTALCGVFFNTQGLLYEKLREEGKHVAQSNRRLQADGSI